jgi:hypothetical protein
MRSRIVRAQRFLQRNPELAPRKAQSVSKSRNEIRLDDLNSYFYKLMKLMVDYNFD